MGLALLLGLLLSRAAGDLLALPSSDCIAAEQQCLSDSTCNTTYRILENCALAKTRLLPLDHDSRVRCLNAELDLGNSSLLHCRCHRRMKRQEHCLRIFWTVHSSMTDGYFNLETSPYENPANEEHWKTDYNKLAALLSGSQLAGDATNPCLKATHVCNLSKKCVRLRTDYASICTRGAGSEDTCDRRKCHRGLRNFFEKVPEEFTKRILFCPCQDELCGERRRKTIVPDCSFQYHTKPNCLWLLDSCLEDHICKSRLADFQQNCQPADMSPDGCSQHNHAVCLQAYMGMIDVFAIFVLNELWLRGTLQVCSIRLAKGIWPRSASSYTRRAAFAAMYQSRLMLHTFQSNACSSFSYSTGPHQIARVRGSNLHTSSQPCRLHVDSPGLGHLQGLPTEGICPQGSIPFSITGHMRLLFSCGDVNPDCSFWGLGTGTPMTPNYISNSSVEISLWCTCESSGNQKEKCDQILGMFENNKCLENTIWSQMHLKQTALERQEDLFYSSSLSFQGDSASTALASEMSQVAEGKTQRDISEHSSMPMASSVYSGAAVSWPSLTLFLPLLLSPH